MSAELLSLLSRPPSPVEERAAFDAVDKANGLRVRVLNELMEKYGPATPFGLSFAIGGQIGIDCAPVGWDKTFCLQFLPEEEYPTIHFFGDKTHPGGGDYEYTAEATIYHGEAVGRWKLRDDGSFERVA